MESVDPYKYITMKREDLMGLVGNWSAAHMADVEVPLLLSDVYDIELRDAVVIRRQDMFAGPALHAYANNMAMAVRMLPRADDEQQKHLLAVADYFHEQAVLADEEAKKLPD